jgi:hypothetical protein
MSTPPDPNRKTLRHFYCRDLLWQTFEQMSETMDHGVDDLVNEAMRVFAEQKGYFVSPDTEPQVPAGVRESSPGRSKAPTPPRSDLLKPAPPPRLELPKPGVAPRSEGAKPAIPPPLPPGRMTAHYAARPPAPAVPPPAPPPAVPGDGSGSAPSLYLIFGNQKYLVDKEQFIIGRGAKSSDLPIRDGNISRKHAAVVRKAGAYYIKDLGSTNGIDYKGERIEARKIEEGDIYSICDYQLKFTFK